MPLTLRIIRPSSREPSGLLELRLAELRALGHTVRYDDLPPDPSWLYAAGTAQDRAQALQAALTEPGTDAVLGARGGYGASDLLPLLDWQALAKVPPRLLVGFSDVSALHAALYARLGWPGLHAPMPATVLWRKDGEARDVDALLAALTQLRERGEAEGSLPVTRIGAGPASVTGRLFGGCFTVLTNLLATPYFPNSLAGHIVFLEDTDEHPARLMRALSQWRQAGVFAGVQALVVGHLRQLGDKIPDSAPFVLEQFAARAGVPVYHSPLFGHTCPNFPLLIGATARLDDRQLTWRYSRARGATPAPGGNPS